MRRRLSLFRLRGCTYVPNESGHSLFICMYVCVYVCAYVWYRCAHIHPFPLAHSAEEGTDIYFLITSDSEWRENPLITTPHTTIHTHISTVRTDPSAYPYPDAHHSSHLTLTLAFLTRITLVSLPRGFAVQAARKWTMTVSE